MKTRLKSWRLQQGQAVRLASFLLALGLLLLVGLFIQRDLSIWLLYLVLAGILGLLLVFKVPQAAIYLVMLASSLEVAGRIRLPSGLPLTFFHLAIFLLTTVFFTTWIARQGFRIILPPEMLLLALFFGIAWFSLFYTPNLPSAVLNLLRFAALGWMSFLLANLISDEHTLWRSCWVFLGLGLIVGLAAMLEFVRQPIAANLVLTPGRGIGNYIQRTSLLFHDPNTLGGYLMVVVSMGLGLLLASGFSWRRRVLLLALVMIGLLGILGTFSRSAWVALLGAFLVVVLLGQRRRRLLWVAAAVLAVFIVALLILPQARLLTRHFSTLGRVISDPSSNVRYQMGLSALAMWRDHPLLGVGFRGFPIAYQTYRLAGSSVRLTEIHTLALEILAELGIIGLLVMAGFVLRLSWRGLRAVIGEPASKLRGLLLGSTAAFLGMVIRSFFYPGLYDNYLWILIGLLLAALRLQLRRGEEQNA